MSALTTITHEAFLDLERSLVDRVLDGWLENQSSLLKRLQTAVDKEKWDDAHDLAEQISFETAVGKARKHVQVIGLASILLGASRISGSENSSMADRPPVEILETALTQIETLLVLNAQPALQTQAHGIIEDRRREALESETLEKAESMALRTVIQVGGKSYVDVASSMYVSRLSSFGFLGEAALSGIAEYAVSEILDSRTCPVCQSMDGRVFPVNDALTHATSMLSRQDPNDLRQIAPWPSQSRANVERLGKMSSSDLQANGMQLPPYHPMCRGIATSVGDVSVPSTPVESGLQTLGTVEVAPGRSLSEGGASATAATDLMFQIGENKDRTRQEDRTDDLPSLDRKAAEDLLKKMFPSLFG